MWSKDCQSQQVSWICILGVCHVNNISSKKPNGKPLTDSAKQDFQLPISDSYLSLVDKTSAYCG